MAASAKEQIEIGAALIRIYVFLAQYLDRCFDEAARKTYPDAELQRHLADTRQQLMDMLAVNPVVQQKLADDCDRILTLGASGVRTGESDPSLRDTIHAERAVLQSKTIALSDLVAVFRALE